MDALQNKSKNELIKEIKSLNKQIRDIAIIKEERQQTKERLRTSEALLKEAQKVAHIGHWELDPAIGTPVWSEEIFRIFGIDPDKGEPSFTDHEIHTHPEDWPILDEAITRASTNGIPFDIVFRLVRPDGGIRWMHAIGTAVKDKTGKVKNLFGTAQDITAHKQVEIDLRESKQIIERIINAVPARIFWKDKNLVFLGCNEIFARDAGFSDPKEIIGKDDFQMGWSDQAELYRQDDRQVIENGITKLLIEEKQTTPEGNIITLLTNKIPLRNSKGEIIGVLGTYMDITERKQIEETLREKKLQLEMTIRASNIGLWDWDLNSNVVYYSPKWKQQIGYEEWEISNDFSEWKNRVHPNDLEQAASRVQKFIENPYPDFENEFRFRHKDGTYRWILAKASVITDEQGKPIRMLGSHLDVTERKRTEEKRRESEDNLRRAEQIAHIGYWSRDIISGEIEWSDETYRIFGLDPQVKKLNLATLPDHIHSEDRHKVIQAIQNAVAGIQPYDQEYRIQRPDGTIRWVHSKGEVSKNEDGQPSRMFGVVLDITERKQTEDILCESEERFRKIFEESPLGMVIARPNHSRFLRTNAVFCKMLGYTQDEIQSMTFLDITDPEDHARDVKSFKKLWEGQITQFKSEKRYLKKNGKILLGALTVSVIHSEEGKPLYYIVMIEDITTRKRMEEVLRESEKKYRNLIENINDVFYTVRADGVITFVNSAVEHVLEYKPDELIGKYFSEFICPEDLNRILDLFGTLKDGSVNPSEYRMIKKSGEICYVRSSSKGFYNRSKFLGITGILTDITLRIKAENAVKESEKKFRIIAEQIADVIFITDLSGLIKYISPASNKVFGFSEEEMTGRIFTEFLHDSEISKAMHAFNKTLSNGSQTKDLILQFIRKDGSLFYGEFDASIMRKGEVTCGILGLIRDVSERIIAQEKIKKSHEQLQQLYKHLDNIIEKERTYISREIHDELGQSLTVLKFDLEALLDNTDDKSLILRKTNDMLELVSNTIQDVQRLSSHLRPAMLDDLGLSSTIDWYCNDFEKRTGINCTLDIEDIVYSDPQGNLALFRILQEALTNIIRHAKASKVNVMLCSNNDEINLEVKDDGIGISKEKINDITSLGLIGIRERIKQFNGHFEVISEINKGTCLSVGMPIN